jgi:hypothetical protein
MTTGWLCSHVVAVLHLSGVISVAAMLKPLPAVRAPGRPTRIGSALARDTPATSFFNVDNLMRILIKNPARVYKWNVLKAFVTTDDTSGEQVEEYFSSRVETHCITADGKFRWKVNYTDGTSDDMEVEALALCINLALVKGLPTA